MRNNFKRFLGVAFVLIMALSVMTVGAFAAEETVAKIGDAEYATLADAMAEAKAGKTITLTADVTENVTIGKKLTIDGDDNQYTGNISLTNRANITIKDVNFDGKGYNGYAVEAKGAYYLTIEDCTAKNYGKGFVQLSSGNVLTTVKNVTVSDVNYGVKVDYSNAVVIENADINARVAGILNSNYGEKTITVKDSKISIIGTWTRNNTINSTFLFEGANTVDEFVIDANIDTFKLAEGATLAAPAVIDVTTDVADSYVAYKNGVYSVEANTKVAAIGTKKYATLADAVAAAKAGQTIKLLCDASGAGVVIDENVNINFGGFTYTITEPVGSKGTESNGFQILDGNKVTLRNGKLEVAESAADKFYILVQNYSNLTVSNMTLDGTNLDKWSKTDGDSYTLSNNSGAVTVNGESNIIANNDGALAFAFDACDKSSWGYSLPTVNVAKTVTIDGNIEAAAKVGNTYYASLQEAVAKVNTVNASNGTITLFADANLDEDDVVKTADGLDVMLLFDGKNVTLDLNGKMINVDYDKNVPLYSVVHVADGVTLAVNDSVGTGGIELNTGATKAGKYDCVYYMFWKRGTSGRLNIHAGNFHANNLEDSMVYTNGNNTVAVKGGKFVLDSVGTEKNGSPWIFNTQGQNENKIFIYGGTFNADVFHQYWFLETKADNNLALKANGDGTYTVVEAAYYVTEYYYYGKLYSKSVGYVSLEEAEVAAAKNTETSKKVAKIVEL